MNSPNNIVTTSLKRMYLTVPTKQWDTKHNQIQLLRSIGNYRFCIP